MTFEDYLRKNYDNIIIDHALRAEIVDDQVRFYIHPAQVSGDTLDFVVKGNTLSIRNLAGPLNSNNINQGTLDNRI